MNSIIKMLPVFLVKVIFGVRFMASHRFNRRASANRPMRGYMSRVVRWPHAIRFVCGPARSNSSGQSSATLG